MPDQIDELNIKVTADSASASKELDKVISRVEKLHSVSNKKSGDSLSETLKKLGAATSKINANSGAALGKLATGLSKLNGVGKVSISPKFAERITEINNAIAKIDGAAVNKLYKLAKAMSTLKGTGSRVTLPKPQVQGEGNAAEMSGTETVTSEAATATESNGSRIIAVFNRIKSAATSAASAIKDRFKKAFSGLSNIVRLFMKRVVYRLFNAIISGITNAIKNGINAVYQWSASLDERFSKSMDTIATAGKYLSASLGAMISPILDMLAPVIDELVDKFVEVLNLVNQIAAVLSGSDYWRKAVKTAVKYGDAIDDAASATKKLKDYTMGFDKLNIISDNGSQRSGADSLAGYNFEKVYFKEGEVQKLKDTFDDILKAITTIGVALAAWNVAGFVAQLLQLDKLQTLKFTVSATLLITSIKFGQEGADEYLHGKTPEEKSTGGLKAAGSLVGTTIAGGGLAAALPALGISFGEGGLIGLAIGSLAIGIKGVIDAAQNGLNQENSNLINLLGEPFATLAKAIIWTVQNWGNIVSFVKGVVTAIQEIFGGLWTDISTKAGELWESLKLLFSDPAEWFRVNVTEPIGKFFGTLWNDIQTGSTNLINDYIKKPFDDLVTWFDTRFIEPVKKLFKPLADWFDKTVISPIKTSSLQPFFEWAWGILLKLFDFARDCIEIVNRLGESSWVILSGIWTGRIFTDFEGMKSQVQAIMSQALPSVANPTKNIFSVIPSTGAGKVIEQNKPNAIRDDAGIVGSISYKQEEGSRHVGGTKFGVAASTVNEESIQRAISSALKTTSLAVDSNVYLDGKQITNSVESRQRETGARIYGNNGGGVMYVI